MKIVDKNYLPIVVGAAVVGDRMLRLLFSDGTAGDVDFSGDRGTIVWPGGIDLAPEPLHEQAKAHPLLAA